MTALQVSPVETREELRIAISLEPLSQGLIERFVDEDN